MRELRAMAGFEENFIMDIIFLFVDPLSIQIIYFSLP